MFTKPISIKTQVALITKAVTFHLHPTTAHLEVEGGGKVRGSLKPCTSQGHGQERWHGPGSSILWLFAGESGGVGISRWLPGTTNGWQWMQKKWMQKCRRNEKKTGYRLYLGFLLGSDKSGHCRLPIFSSLSPSLPSFFSHCSLKSFIQQILLGWTWCLGHWRDRTNPSDFLQGTFLLRTHGVCSLGSHQNLAPFPGKVVIGKASNRTFIETLEQWEKICLKEQIEWGTKWVPCFWDHWITWLTEKLWSSLSAEVRTKTSLAPVSYMNFIFFVL